MVCIGLLGICSDRPCASHHVPATLGAYYLMPTQKTDRKGISVEIQLMDGDFPTAQEFDLRWALEDQVNERGIGIINGAGAGGGRMDFSFEVGGSDAVEVAIDEVRQLLEEYHVLQRANITVFDVYEAICQDTPDFHPGDCLSFRFGDHDYGAVLVLARGNAGLHIEEILTLVGVLDYKAPEPPNMSVFEERRWLIATATWRTGQPYLVWLNCYGGVDFVTVGKVALCADDPTECRFYLSWEDIPEYFMKEKLRDTN